MKLKRSLLYLLVGGLLILATLIIHIYQEYLGEDTTPVLIDKQNPIIAQKVNGVVAHTAINTIGQQQKLDVTYTVIGSSETAHLMVNTEYKQRVHPGDTVTKDKGERVLLINRKGGEIEIVPID